MLQATNSTAMIKVMILSDINKVNSPSLNSIKVQECVIQNANSIQKSHILFERQ